MENTADGRRKADGDCDGDYDGEKSVERTAAVKTRRGGEGGLRGEGGRAKDPGMF
jgi:hypothetical protein